MPPKNIKVCNGRVCGESSPGRLKETVTQAFPDAATEYCPCTGYCEEGPNIIADGKIYHHAKPRDIVDRLKAENGATLSEIDIDAILMDDELFI